MKPYDMGTLFDECADRGSGTTVHLDRPFDIARDSRVEYDVPSLAELVREVSGWLAATGAGAGDHVVIIKDNHWDYDLLACAAVRIGAVPALLSGHLPAETLGTLVTRLDPVALVSTGLLLENARAEGVDLASFAGVTLSLDTPTTGAITVDDVSGHTPPAPRRRHDDEPLVVNHTSGTTGMPKLVVHSTGTIIRRLARLESVRFPVL
ncbi:MAG: AMP-binding protein, partial [Sciscionella sp.]